jgi:hypothetical protein
MNNNLSKVPTKNIELESDLILYAFGGLLLFNMYNKYSNNNFFSSDDSNSSDSNIVNTDLHFVNC